MSASLNFDFPSGHEPRRGRLTASGIILGMIGCLMGLLATFYLMADNLIAGAMTVSSGATGSSAGPANMDFMRLSMMMAGVLMGSIAALFLVTAYGSIFLRRWARPVALYLSFTWLYLGFVYLVWMLVFMGPMQREMMAQMNQAMATAPGGPPSPGSTPPMAGMEGMFTIMMIVGVVMIAVFGIMLPGLVIWLNWHRDVRVTLEFCDSKPRWTDRCPVPVLGIAFGAITIAVINVPSLIMGWFPLFGKMLTGTGAQLAILGTSLLFLLIAWTVYRRMMIGWALAVLAMILFATSGVLTMLYADYHDLYAAMGMDEALIEQSMGSIKMMQDAPGSMVMMILAFLPALGFVIWCFRYFKKPLIETNAALPTASA
ncbi:MAG: hypothetical protein KDN20_08615 [Verrucomicrobiae bacterium]|nr:hypothetical protein [Verrucomicrobiae bacterium]